MGLLINILCDGRDLLRRCAMVACSIWDILSYGHTELKTSHDHLRWAKFGRLWTIGWWIVCNRVMSTSQLSSIVQSSRDVAEACTIFSHVLTCTAFSRCCAMILRCLTTSYEPSYDFNRVQMMTSASRQIIIYSEVVRPRTTVIWRSYDAVLFPYDYLRACDCPKCVANPYFPVWPQKQDCNIVAEPRTIIDIYNPSPSHDVVVWSDQGFSHIKYVFYDCRD